MNVEHPYSAVEPVLVCYGFPSNSTISLESQGRTHATYRIDCANGQSYVLQKLHRIIEYPLLEDIEFITSRLKDCGLQTTELIRTRDGNLGVKNDGAIWRALTFIPGVCFDGGLTRDQLREAGNLVGRFHHALHDSQYNFQYPNDEYHDTQKRIDRMRQVVKAYQNDAKIHKLAPLADEVSAEYDEIKTQFFDVPKRTIHGDLKINNVRFSEDSAQALALLDLDTMCRGPINIDVGDAARSWCNVSGEDQPDEAKFDLEIFESMIDGYYSSARFLTPDEKKSVPYGILLLTLELAARFISDSFEETYWTLDASRYNSLHDQNFTKATAQLVVFRDAKRQLQDIQRICAI